MESKRGERRQVKGAECLKAAGPAGPRRASESAGETESEREEEERALSASPTCKLVSTDCLLVTCWSGCEPYTVDAKRAQDEDKEKEGERETV